MKINNFECFVICGADEFRRIKISILKRPLIIQRRANICTLMNSILEKYHGDLNYSTNLVITINSKLNSSNEHTKRITNLSNVEWSSGIRRNWTNCVLNSAMQLTTRLCFATGVGHVHRIRADEEHPWSEDWSRIARIRIFRINSSGNSWSRRGSLQCHVWRFSSEKPIFEKFNRNLLDFCNNSFEDVRERCLSIWIRLRTILLLHIQCTQLYEYANDVSPKYTFRMCFQFVLQLFLFRSIDWKFLHIFTGSILWYWSSFDWCATNSCVPK